MKLSYQLFAISTLLSSTRAERNPPERNRSLVRGRLQESDNRNTGVFPRVYTTLVPDPFSNEKQRTNFVAGLDLLEILECDLHIDEDDTNYCKIAFLVHSEKALGDLLPSAKTQNQQTLDLDRQRTEAMTQTETAQADEPSRLLFGVSTIPGYSCYPDLAGSKQIMDSLVEQAESVPNLSVSIVDIGDSYLKTKNPNEGYDIWALEITGRGVNYDNNEDSKAVFFSIAGNHPRELPPPALLAHWAQELVSGYGTDAEITNLLDQTKVCLVFHTNPDGRQLVETTDIWQRKNLNTESSSTCGSEGGVDLNRNFPFRWGLDSGSSSDPCAGTYRGSAPNSEPETQAIVQYAESLFPVSQRKSDPEGDIDEAYDEATTKGVFVDMHSYGEVIIFPWGHDNKTTGNRYSVEAMVHKISHFSGYALSGPGFGYAYPASGSTDDWAYGTLGVAGMTWELGTDFHQNCSYFEDHVLPDNLPALTYLASLAYAPYSMSKGPDILSASVDVTVPNGQQQPVVSLQVTASDAAYSSLPTAQQAVAEVRVFLDVHPNQLPDGNSPQYLQLELSPSGSDSGTITGSLSITVQDFLGSSSSPNNAGDRRTLYIQAIDSDGYSGPVTAVWLDQADVREGVCSEGDLDFDFTITTDSYSYDTSWSLVNSQGESVLSGGSYENDSSYYERQCLPNDAYTLAIYDSYGDGLCCGITNPGYALSVDGNIILQGDADSFGSEVSVDFGGGCEDSNQEFVTTNGLGLSCAWLSNNIVHWAWMCDRVEVAKACPITCQACTILS